jgi:thiol-disulfide isomerase/thioredoxin
LNLLSLRRPEKSNRQRLGEILNIAERAAARLHLVATDFKRFSDGVQSMAKFARFRLTSGLLGLLLLAGCGPRLDTLISPGDPAPELVAAEWVGGDAPAADGKILVVDVFATWCGPCAKATPGLVEVYNEFHPRGVEFVAITSEELSDKGLVQAFRQHFSVPWAVGMDAGDTIQQLGVSYIPMIVVIGPDGKVLSVGDDEPRLRSTLSKALAQAEPSA